jgi:hypothetical protein
MQDEVCSLNLVVKCVELCLLKFMFESVKLDSAKLLGCCQERKTKHHVMADHVEKTATECKVCSRWDQANFCCQS